MSRKTFLGHACLFENSMENSFTVFIVFQMPAADAQIKATYEIIVR